MNSCAADQSACPTGSVSIGCSSAANCSGGEVCCFGANGAGGGGGATCQSTCMGIQICQSSAECTTPGDQCQTFGGGGGGGGAGFGFGGFCLNPNFDAGNFGGGFDGGFNFGRDGGGGG